MSKRKPGSNKRQPNATSRASKCVSYYLDGSKSPEFFTPKAKPKQMQIRIIDGKAVLVKVERALL